MLYLIKRIQHRKGKEKMKQYNVKITTSSKIDWGSLPKADIDSYVWGGADRAHKAYGQVAYAATGNTDEGLYIHLYCSESNPVSIETEHNGRVWEDSCLEIFFTMHHSDASCKEYINMECNSIGITLIAFGKNREERKFIIDMGIEPFPARVTKNENGWDVFEFVPLTALKEIFKIDKVDEDTVMAGNFYKCDENAGAPFGSWSPVLTPFPDFHRPEFFGRFILSK